MQKKRILIVDDEASFTRLLQLNLAWTGRYTVRTECCAADALAAVREFKPDLMLLDVMMPGMDGGELAARLQRNPATQDIAVLFVTAAVKKDEVTSRQGHIGGLEYVAKPIDFEDLIQRIDAHLSPVRRARADPAGPTLATH
jgi:CheY-like chemotaxis protein